MKAVGIDLGTTNSLVAIVQEGQPRALADSVGRVLLPSVVTYTETGPDVGYSALDRAALSPQDTVASVKRLLGRAVNEIDTALLTNTLEQDDAVIRIRTRFGAVTPTEVSAEILRVLADRAESAVRGPKGLLQIVEPGEGAKALRAVITVPAYFDDAQRQATRQAGRLAGLDVIRLLNEPTAAALAYGLEKQTEGKFAVFDLGGGTFDISILHLVDGVFEVLATGGDSALGGDDFDQALAMSLLKRAEIDPVTAPAAIRLNALAAARAAKVALTDKHDVDVSITREGGEAFVTQVTRDDFERIIAPILERVAAPCRQALRDAKLRPAQLDGVVLVGGSTRSPAVRAFVADLFDQKPLGDIDPDQVVALGAALQADLLSADSELRGTDAGDVLLLDITPLSLGLETMGQVVEKIIPRGSKVPASRGQEFTTGKDGQTAMDIHVLQGERDLVEDCRSLARFQLKGIPSRAAGLARVRVTFQVDADGILSVSARELSSGVEQSVVVRPSHGLSDAQIEAMLQASLDNAESDLAARGLRSARSEAAQVIAAIGKALTEDADLLEADEASTIRQVISDLDTAQAGDESGPIETLTKLLDRVSAGFAQRRMERALRSGLVGQGVNLDTLASEVETDES